MQFHNFSALHPRPKAKLPFEKNYYFNSFDFVFDSEKMSAYISAARHPNQLTRAEQRLIGAR